MAEEAPRTEKPASREAKLWEIIRKLEVGLLTVRCADGRLRARPVVAHCEESDQTLWFFTSEDVCRPRATTGGREVSLGFADAGKQLYAVVAGRAIAVRDRATRDKYWRPGLLAWFPSGLDEPGLVLLRLKVRTGEYWDAPAKSTVELIAAVQEVFDNAPTVDAGDHGRVRLS
jgi:general stress protein 26